MLDKEVLAPGIILYRADKDHAKRIVEMIKLVDDEKWNKAGVVNTDTYDGEFSESRVCSDFGLVENMKDPQMNALYQEIDSWVDGIIEDYRQTLSVERLVTGPYIVLKYTEGGKFDNHVDDGKKYPRTVSMSAYLNEEFDDGEIEFPLFNIKHKPKTGDVVMFCSAFPYMHRVNPVKNGIRYTVVNWYRYVGYPPEM